MEEFATDSANAVAPGSAPVETTEVNETVNTLESVPEETVAEAEENIEEQGAKPSKAVQELIQQRKKRQEAERELAYWKGLAEGRGGQPEQPKQTKAEPSGPPSAPSSDDFETWDDYEQARDDYRIRLAEYRLEQKFNERLREQQTKTVQQQYVERIEKAAEADPAIWEIANDNSLPVSQAMAEVIQRSDLAPQLLRWLHNNRKEAQRIASLPPSMSTYEMGMVVGQLKATPKPTPPKKVSAAPEPIQTLNPTSSATIDEDDLPIEEYHRRRTAKMFGRP